MFLNFCDYSINFINNKTQLYVTMNRNIKRFLLGLIIWGLPFLGSFFVWDMQSNTPSVSLEWFNALMAFLWALGYSIAAYYYFRNIDKKNAKKEGIVTGIIWYVELCLLDLIFLVGMFKMSIANYWPIIVTYLNALLISFSIGYIIQKK